MMKLLFNQRVRAALDRFYNRGWKDAVKLKNKEIEDVMARMGAEIEQAREHQLEHDKIIMGELRQELTRLAEENKALRNAYKDYIDLKNRLEYIAPRLEESMKSFKLDVTGLFQDFAKISQEVDNVTYLHDRREPRITRGMFGGKR